MVISGNEYPTDTLSRGLNFRVIATERKDYLEAIEEMVCYMTLLPLRQPRGAGVGYSRTLA